MRGVYSIEKEIANISAACYLLYVQAPAAKVMELLSVHVGNQNSNTSWNTSCRVVPVTGTAGGGTALTIANDVRRHEPGGDQASQIQLARLGPVTGLSLTDTQGGWGHKAWNSLGHYDNLWTLDAPIVPVNTAIALELELAPGATFKAIVNLVWREIG